LFFVPFQLSVGREYTNIKYTVESLARPVSQRVVPPQPVASKKKDKKDLPK